MIFKNIMYLIIMLQGQLNPDRKIAHRGNPYQSPTSNGRVRKGHISTQGFITPNSLGARIIDADRIRLLNSYDIKILNEKTPLRPMPPNQIEAYKTLLPLGILQDRMSQFPFIANTPGGFIYKKEAETIKDDREAEHIKQTEGILDRIEAIQKAQINSKEIMFA